jgi:GDP-4-dehydro-6-deoxy-D-mannose reductase
MRDYLDIEDVCDGLTAIAKKGKRGQVYNICSGNPISIEDILRGLIEASQLNVEIVIDKVRFQAADVNRIFGSNHNIAQDTSWKQQISIKDSLKEAIK